MLLRRERKLLDRWSAPLVRHGVEHGNRRKKSGKAVQLREGSNLSDRRRNSLKRLNIASQSTRSRQHHPVRTVRVLPQLGNLVSGLRPRRGLGSLEGNSSTLAPMRFVSLRNRVYPRFDPELGTIERGWRLAQARRRNPRKVHRSGALACLLIDRIEQRGASTVIRRSASRDG